MGSILARDNFFSLDMISFRMVVALQWLFLKKKYLRLFLTCIIVGITYDFDAVAVVSILARDNFFSLDMTSF